MHPSQAELYVTAELASRRRDAVPRHVQGRTPRAHRTGTALVALGTALAALGRRLGGAGELAPCPEGA